MRSPHRLSLLVALSVAVNADAEVLYVDASAPPGGDGASWRTALSSLDEALALAAAGAANEIRVREGLYVPSQRVDVDPRSARFVIPAGISLLGGFAGTERSPADRNPERHPTILSGDLLGNDDVCDTTRSDNAYRVVELAGGAVTLDSLTIRSGRADGRSPGASEGAAIGGAAQAITLIDCCLDDNLAVAGGAALLAREASVTLQRCSVRLNRSDAGVVWIAPNPGDVIRVEDCTFQSNRCDATDSSAALVVRGAVVEGQLLVLDSDFIDNQAGLASALLIEDSHAIVASCRFLNNTGGDGAGLRVKDSVALVRDSLFSTNAALGDGGALFACARTEVPLRIERSTFLMNSSVNGGAAAVYGHARMTFVECTFTGNDAAGAGGAISSGAPTVDGMPGTTLVLQRCVVRGNQAGSAGGGLFANHHDVAIADSLVIGNEAAIGGALRSAFTALSIERSTIAGNDAASYGAGVVKSESSLTLVDSIVWANGRLGDTRFESQLQLSPPEGSGAFLSLVRSCVQSLPREYEIFGGFSLDPKFVDLDGPDGIAGTIDDDVTLAADSPCINAGDPALMGTRALDLLGAPRIAACRVDLGAIESALQPAMQSDCNDDGISDACSILNGEADCNSDGTPDACEIAEGADDCNRNGVPDACELEFQAFVASGDVKTPFGAGEPLTITIRDPGPAQSDVTFTLTARGAFGAPEQFVAIVVNGVAVGSLLEVGAHCAHEPETRSLSIPKGEWNALLRHEEVTVAFVPTGDVDPNACAQSLAHASIQFNLLPSGDANSNGVVDSCELVADLDGDDVVADADLAILITAWGPCSLCAADLDASGSVGAEDLAILLGAWSDG